MGVAAADGGQPFGQRIEPTGHRALSVTDGQAIVKHRLGDREAGMENIEGDGCNDIPG